MYHLTLTFLDPLSDASGQRLITVKVNDQVMLLNFDIWAAGGRRTSGAIKRSTLVPVGLDGQIVIEITAAGEQSAICNAISAAPVFLLL